MIFTDKEKYALSFQTEIKLELKKINTLLNLLDNPHFGNKYIHVAGTNGKGSVCAFLENILVKSGKKVGIFSSPELVKKNETIRFCGKEISDFDLKRLVNKVSVFAEKMEEYPSPFEIICAVAFLYFKERECDYVVLEAGMGGMGDATNVIPSAEICVLTHIDLDHMQYLGNTVTKITKVKSGIIKENSKVITIPQNGDFSVIKDVCQKKNAILKTAEILKSSGFEDMQEIVEYNNKKIKLSLSGINQVENASIAVKVAEELSIKEQYIISGLKDAKNPGRFEKLCEGVYFDGAHNPNGAKALKDSLDRYIGSREKTFVMGVMKDKDLSKMLNILKGSKSNFAFVNIKGNPRAMKNSDMQKIAFNSGIYADVYDDVNAAIKSIKKRPLFICGSLYMYKHKDKNIFKEAEYE